MEVPNLNELGVEDVPAPEVEVKRYTIINMIASEDGDQNVARLITPEDLDGEKSLLPFKYKVPKQILQISRRADENTFPLDFLKGQVNWSSDFDAASWENKVMVFDPITVDELIIVILLATKHQHGTFLIDDSVGWQEAINKPTWIAEALTCAFTVKAVGKLFNDDLMQKVKFRSRALRRIQEREFQSLPPYRF